MAQGNRKPDDPAHERETVPPELERQINENLRQLYNQALEEEIPEHLQKLLQRLSDEEQGRYEEQDQDKDRVR